MAKTPTQVKHKLEQARDTLDEVPDIIDKPYVSDARSFLTQALACIEKQIIVELAP